MLDIVDMEQRMTGDEVRVGGFDLVWRDGPYVHNKMSTYTSMLGACSLALFRGLSPGCALAVPILYKSAVDLSLLLCRVRFRQAAKRDQAAH